MESPQVCYSGMLEKEEIIVRDPLGRQISQALTAGGPARLEASYTHAFVRLSMLGGGPSSTL